MLFIYKKWLLSKIWYNNIDLSVYYDLSEKKIKKKGGKIMNDVIVKDEVVIENLIYEIRGKQVMLDSDLARLYECVNGTKDINKAVKRNIEKFPENFMFQLTNVEYDNLRFQIGTSKVKGGRRYNPYVFTEQGVAMLSSVLHSENA